MRKLKVDLDELAYALEDASWETDYYLDLETGQVVMVRDETRRELESFYEETYDPKLEEAFDLAQALKERDLPEWYQQELLETDRVEQEYLSRYISLSSDDPHQGYRDMEDFIVTVRDERLQDRLWQATRGRGAFRRFKDTLARHPREEKRWFEFKDKLMRQRVLDWLASENIEPIIEPRPAPDPPPSVRPRLIEVVLISVRAASQLRGVTRIALIGSLTTDEPEPKDVDLLVTVTDEANLAPLATLGRKLNGHAQSLGRGGEVFLADPRGNYLGRTCPWKECGPGIRARRSGPRTVGSQISSKAASVETISGMILRNRNPLQTHNSALSLAQRSRSMTTKIRRTCPVNTIRTKGCAGPGPRAKPEKERSKPLPSGSTIGRYPRSGAISN